MAKVFQIRPLEVDKTASCLWVLNQLPNWFAQQEARESYARAAEDLIVLGSFADAGDLIGILTLKVHNSWNAEIHVMGVLPDWHRQGAGTLLVRDAEHYAQETGTRFLTVKTLSSKSDDPCYDQTRQFYLAMGFQPFEELPTLWSPANPCLLMIKNLHSE